MPNMPIQLATSPEMQAVFQCLDPKMPIPSSINQLKDILFEQSAEIKQRLRTELHTFKGSISSTIGVWKMDEPFAFSSTYVTIMVHFINGDKLQHRFLGALQLPKTTNIEQAYRQILDEYELDLTDIYRTCVNGTSSIVNAFVNYGNPSLQLFYNAKSSLLCLDETTQNQLQSTPNSPIETKPNVKKERQLLESVHLDTQMFEKDSNEENIDAIVRSLNDEQCHPCISHDLKLILFNTIKGSLINAKEFQRMLGLFARFQGSQAAMTDLISLTGQAFIPIQQNEWSSWIAALEYYLQHRHLLAQVILMAFHILT